MSAVEKAGIESIFQIQPSYPLPPFPFPFPLPVPPFPLPVPPFPLLPDLAAAGVGARIETTAGNRSELLRTVRRLTAALAMTGVISDRSFGRSSRSSDSSCSNAAEDNLVAAGNIKLSLKLFSDCVNALCPGACLPDPCHRWVQAMNFLFTAIINNTFTREFFTNQFSRSR